VTILDQAQRRQVNLNPSVSHVRADGHLLIVSLGYEIVAIDVLGNGAEKSARILWRVELNDVFPGMVGGQNVHPRVVQMPWGVPRFMAADANGRAIGTTGPVTPRYASFLKQRALHVVAPLSGRTLWIRHDIDPGSDLFGDDEYLFVTPSNESQNGRDGNTLVYRVADGEKVKELVLPRADQRVAVYGRRLLAWSHEGGKAVLKLVDGFDGKTLWSESFPADARLWPVGADEASVFTKAGKLTVLSVVDGAKRLEASVMPEPQLQEAFVFRTADSYLLVTNSPLRQKEGVNIQPVPGGLRPRDAETEVSYSRGGSRPDAQPAGRPADTCVCLATLRATAPRQHAVARGGVVLHRQTDRPDGVRQESHRTVEHGGPGRRAGPQRDRDEDAAQLAAVHVHRRVVAARKRDERKGADEGRTLGGRVMRKLIALLMVAVGTSGVSTASAAGVDREKIDRAVERGLQWLAAKQSTQGHFTANDGNYPTAMTALAGMAFLCEGSTTTQGKYS
jgi:hypothetical protein